MEYVAEARRMGGCSRLAPIRGILERLADDPDVMERVRKLRQNDAGRNGK